MPDGELKIKYVHGFRCFDGSKETTKFVADN